MAHHGNISSKKFHCIKNIVQCLIFQFCNTIINFSQDYVIFNILERVASMQLVLIGDYFYFLKLKWVITKPQGLATGGGHVLETYFSGYDIGIFLMV